MTLQPQSRRTQAERRTQSRNAILEAAARGISQHGYASLNLAAVAEAAGYTRGAIYHQFNGKEGLALAVVSWVDETWYAEVGRVLSDATEPVEALLSLARLHAVYSRRDSARVLLMLRLEFNQPDHPVTRAIAELNGRLDSDCGRLIRTGRKQGSIPPPVADTAMALTAALEGVGIEIAGRAPHDVELAERAVRGILGLPPR